MYHIVDRRIRAPIAVSEEAFERHLEHVRREGYPILTLDDVLRVTHGDSPVPERALFVTFDDAYADTVHAALPRLREHGVEATMFVPTKYLGEDNGWNERATYRVRHLDWDELERWVAGGGRVGGHTHGHEDAATAAPDELDESILLNRRLLTERLGLNLTAFAYPYGHLTPRARSTVAREYSVAFSVDDGGWDVRRDRFAINRVNVGFDLSSLDFALELERRFDDLAVGRRRPAQRVAREVRTPRARREPPSRRPHGPRIALVAGSGADVLGYPVEPRFVDLLDDGWDVHLIHRTGLLDLGGLRALDEGTLRRRLHPPPVPVRRPYPRAMLVSGLLRSAATRPSSVAATLRRTDDRTLRYRASILLALRPDIVHVPHGEAGAPWLALRDVVRARFVGSAGTGLPQTSLDAAYVETPRAEGAGMHPVIRPTVDGLDIQGLSELDGKPGERPFRVLGVGELSWRQGYEHLLHAVRLLEDRGVRCECRLVGSGTDEDALTFARHQLGLLGAVELDTASAPLGLLAHLRWADVLVNPAVVPAVPWPLVHAQAFGMPLVTTPLPHGAEEPGLVVNRRDPVGLADALERLATNPVLTGELGAAAARRAALSTLDEQLRRFRDLYRSVLT